MLIIVMDKFTIFVIYDTPLTAAIKTSNDELIQEILNANANVTIEDKNEKDPLYLAIENANNDLYHKLIEMPEIDIAKVYPQTGQIILHVACQYCNYDIVESILNNESTLIQPDIPDNNGNTPLHLAASYRFPEGSDEENQKQGLFSIIQRLISLGCDPSQANKCGKCPFTLAVDDETREVMGKAISEAGYQEARQQRVEFWKNYQKNLATTRMDKKKDEQKDQQTMKKTKTQRNVKLETMTLKGGTLRNTNARLSTTSKVAAQPTITEVRPWGGSKETDSYRRQIRLRLRKMNNELHENLQKMLDQAHELENRVYGEQDTNENEGENQNEEENQHEPDNEVENHNEENQNEQVNETENDATEEETHNEE